MRLRIFSSVLLPAPLLPMILIASPRATAKLTSCSAQKGSTVVPRSRRHPPATASTTFVGFGTLCLIRYFLDRPRTSTALPSDDIRELPFGRSEEGKPCRENRERHERAVN